MTEPLRNVFGDELEIVGDCSTCGAPATRPAGTREGPTIFHRDGCRRGHVPFGDHHATRNVIEQCKARDAKQSEAQEYAMRNPNPFRKAPPC